MLRFEWDEDKDEINRKKHLIGFETAKPDQSGRGPGAGPHRDPARGIALADLDEGRFLIVNG